MSVNYDNQDDMQRLQQEAIRRVREMQSRAKVNIENTNKEVKQSQPKNKNVRQTEKPRPKEPLKEARYNMQSEPKLNHERDNLHKKSYKVKNNKSQPQLDLMSNIMKNKDQNLILILILILVGEEADAGLILALLYLMM